VAKKHAGIVGNPPGGLVHAGPQVEVMLMPHPVLVQTGAAKDGRLKARLMVDTGAQVTSVDDALCRELGLTPVRYRPIIGVHNKAEDRPVYLMGVGLGMGDGGGAVEIVTFLAEVVGMPTPAGSIDGLLGRDFLVGFRLVYDGPTGRFEIIDRRDALAEAKPTALLVEGARDTGRDKPNSKTSGKARAKSKQQKKSRRKNRR
jgi:hypothetical protein